MKLVLLYDDGFENSNDKCNHHQTIRQLVFVNIPKTKKLDMGRGNQ